MSQEAPFRESQTERRIGPFVVRIWRDVELDWEHVYDAEVDEVCHRLQALDVSSRRMIEDEISKIKGVSAIQIGTGDDNTVLYTSW